MPSLFHPSQRRWYRFILHSAGSHSEAAFITCGDGAGGGQYSHGITSFPCCFVVETDTDSVAVVALSVHVSDAVASSNSINYITVVFVTTFGALTAAEEAASHLLTARRYQGRPQVLGSAQYYKHQMAVLFYYRRVPDVAALASFDATVSAAVVVSISVVAAVLVVAVAFDVN